jgi:chemotaxis protein histidine kinase CheA
LSGEDSAQLVGGNPVASDLAPGRGVGLIVVKDLARSLGGSLQTTTQTGVGTRTEVSLPRPV